MVNPNLIVPPYVYLPSEPMVIRRYRPLKESYIRSFFEKGLYCGHIPGFDDDNEGRLGSNIEVDPATRGALGALGARTTGDREPLSDQEIEVGLSEFHETVRHKYFANCWRLGTDEDDDIWHNYTQHEDVEEEDGFAFETTVGQFIQALPAEPEDPDFDAEPTLSELDETEMRNMHIGAPNSEISVGAVWYQEREGTVRPAAYQKAVNFYKGKNYDNENEFRLLINPFDNMRVLRVAGRAKILAEKPSIGEKHRFFPLNMKKVVNRIVLAPGAKGEQRNKIERVLDDIGISYGSQPEDDLEIVSSSQSGPPLTETYDYGCGLIGTDLYETDEDQVQAYFERQGQEFCEQAAEEGWLMVDVCNIFDKQVGEVIELYKHASTNPPTTMKDYGWNKIQAVHVSRRHGAEEGEEGKEEEYENEKWKDLVSEDSDT